MSLSTWMWEGVLTEEAVRRKLEPTGQLVTRLAFPPGTRLKASALERQVIVTAGQCRLRAGDDVVELGKGQCTTMPAGPYGLEVVGTEAVELLLGFRLPAEVLARAAPPGAK